MTNLSVGTAKTTGIHSVNQNNSLNTTNPGDPSSLIDSLFMTELDAAGLSRLGSNSESIDQNTLKDVNLTESDQKDIKNTDVLDTPPTIDLTDAMQLAAAQILAPTSIPVQSDVALKSLGNNSLNTINGVANQNLLNALTTATSAVDPSPIASPSLSLSNNLPQNVAQVATPNSPNSPVLQDKTALPELSVTPIKIADTTKDLSTKEMSLDQIQAQNQLPAKIAQDSPVLLVKTAQNTPLNQVSQVTLNTKVSSLSDAITKMGGAKVLSANTAMEARSVNFPSINPGKAEFAATSAAVTNASQANMSNDISNLASKSAAQDKTGSKSEDSPVTQAGTANGFIVNPSFTNHQVPMSNLKLEATNTSLATGPLHAEVLQAAKSGGGRISLEVNPDSTGPVRIDLQIDQSGQARLVVHGASDSTQARLQQGGDQLRQEFAQMGLNLSLDMRQNSGNPSFDSSNNSATSSFNNTGGQQFDTNMQNSNRISNMQATSNIVSDIGSASGVNLFA